jgi:uncharacterized membrane protein
MEFDVIARQYLKSCGLKVNSLFLTRQLKSHPDYPSLTSLTDVLDDLGIKHIALKADKEKVDEFVFPLLAHTSVDGQNGFEIVTSLKELEKDRAAFLQRWDGITLMVDGDSVIENEEHNTLARAKKIRERWLFGLLTPAILLYGASFALHWDATAFLFSLLCLAGCLVCTGILLQTMGKDNPISQQFCRGDSASGCNKVLHSKGAKLMGILSLGEAGLIYFTALFLFVLLSRLTATANNYSSELLVVPSSLAIPLTFVSIWYQRNVVKSWCRMCLAIAALCWLQFILVMAAKDQWPSIYPTRDTLPTLFIFLTSFVLTFICWYFLRSLYDKAAVSEESYRQLSSWKRDIRLFTNFLQQGRRVDVSPWPEDIVLGNRHAALQLLIVSNPYCAPCAQSHQDLDKLLQAHPGEIGVTVRLAVVSQDISDRRTKAIDHILQVCLSPKGKNRQQELLHDWFDMMDLDKWLAVHKTLLPHDPGAARYLLKAHADWYVQNNIQHTPTLFLNGSELPGFYTTADLKPLIPQLKELFPSPTNMHEAVHVL